MAAGFQVPAVFTAVDRLTKPIRRMTAGVVGFAQTSSNVIHRVDRGFIRFGRTLKGLAGQFGLFLGGAALFIALSSGIGIIADYEQANVNLASIMGTTVSQTQALQQDSLRLGSITAKTATEVVGLQEAFARLGFETDPILNMTEATIAGSIAMQGELAATAELVGAMVKTFDNFSSIDAPQIIDQMTLATQKSALNFEKLSTGLPIVAGAANAAGVGFSELLALMGKLSDAGIDVSTSSTALRNIFIESSTKGLKYSQILELISKSANKLTASNDQFGKRAAVSSSVLANQLGELAKLNKTIDSASKGQELSGIATLTAARQMDTLKGSVTLLGSAYEGFLLGQNASNGSFMHSIRLIVDVTTKILTLLTPIQNLGGSSEKTAEQIEEYNKMVENAAQSTITILKWVKNLAITYGIAKVALISFNVVMGIHGAITGRAAIAIGLNTTALWAYKTSLYVASVATWVMTGATKALGIALSLGLWPITLIVLGITAMGAALYSMTAKWNEWGAAVSIILGPIGLFISHIQAIIAHWDTLVDSFSSGDILNGIKTIGVILLDTVLKPIEQLLGLAERFTGLNLGFDSVSNFRNGVLESIGEVPRQQTAQDVQTVNPDATNTEITVQRFEDIQRTRSELLIRDESGRAQLKDNSGGSIHFETSWLH